MGRERLAPYLGADQRMNDAFQSLARFGLRKHMITHALTVKCAICREEAGSEGLCDGGHRGTTGFGATPGNRVGIDHIGATRFEQARQRALAAADAAGEAQSERAERRWAHRPMAARMAEGPKIIEVRPASAKNGPKGT